MAFDLKQNLDTGDWEFDQKRDVAGSEGLGLVEQRIHRRLQIVRGSYIYDSIGTLGSRLRSILRMGVPAASAGIEMIIREALAPMDDITITSIQVNTFGDGSGVVSDPSNIHAKVEYQVNLATVTLSSDALGTFDTTVDIAV